MRWGLGTAMLAAVAALPPARVCADVVLDWNTIALATMQNQNPFAQARYAAIVQLAVFDAVNTITGEYEPYLDVVPHQPGASAEAAAVAAAHRVLSTYFPASAATLDSRRAASLAAIDDGGAKDNGIDIGLAVADALIALRALDGSGNLALHVPATAAPGEWRLTPSCTLGGGLFLHWRSVTPFALPGAGQFRAPDPPELTSGVYAHDFDEVRRVGADDSAARPNDRADVARFYAVTSGAVLWNSAARQVAAVQQRSLSHNAWALALLNIALSDSLVASFESKYHFRLWRPETAIRDAHLDGNARTDSDSGFVPFVTSPCFPSYPSAHASSAYAAVEVLTRIYQGGGHHVGLSNPLVPGVTLQYSRFRAIAEDIDDARVYGGIHFRFDQTGGAHQGKAVGSYVLRHALRRRPSWPGR